MLIGNLPAARLLDKTACPGGAVINQGEPTVLINFLYAARVGDPTTHGGKIAAGWASVLIGGAPKPPLLGQATPMSCGIATSRMVIMAITGENAREKDLRDESQKYPGNTYDLSDGTGMDNMEHLLKAHGVNPTYHDGATVDQLAAATKDGKPALVHVPNHFIVVDEVRTNPDGTRTVIGRDPAPQGQGTRIEESEADFNKRKADAHFDT